MTVYVQKVVYKRCARAGKPVAVASYLGLDRELEGPGQPNDAIVSLW